MNTLLTVAHWQSKGHPQTSRGMLASSGRIGAALHASSGACLNTIDYSEDFHVMTSKQRVLFANISRTSLLIPDSPNRGGILWWNTGDEAALTQLHWKCVSIAEEVGSVELCVMCAAHNSAAPLYWQEMLGDDFRYLKRWQ